MSDPRHTMFGLLAVTSGIVCAVDHEGPACKAVGAVASAISDHSTGEQWAVPASVIAAGSSGGGSWLVNGEAEDGMWLQTMQATARRRGTEAALRRRREAVRRLLQSAGEV